MSSFNDRVRDLKGRQKIFIALSLHSFYEIVRSFPNLFNLRGNVLATCNRQWLLLCDHGRLQIAQQKPPHLGLLQRFPSTACVLWAGVTPPFLPFVKVKVSLKVFSEKSTNVQRKAWERIAENIGCHLRQKKGSWWCHTTSANTKSAI